MKARKIMLNIMLVLSLTAAITTATATASVQVDNGVWSYGGHHDPGNWGAFSNYWHPYRWHNSTVVRSRDSRSNTGYAGANATSEAFINTHFGEHVYFYYGF